MMRCDCHVHVVDDVAVAPMVASRTYTAAAAPVAALQAVAAPLGVGRFVVVQPSFYGTDNRVLLRALEALGGAGRGVAVVDPAGIGAAGLHVLHRGGVRGLRLNLYSTLSAQRPQGLDVAVEALATIAAGMGWHVEVLATLPILAQHAGLLGGLAAPVVIDHYGLYAGHAVDSEAGAALLGLLQNANVWMKLSAPYRSEPDALAIRPDHRWLTAILRAAEERCVWGSDWPHTPPHEQQTGGGVPLPYRALVYEDVVAGFRAAVGEVSGDASLAEMIMTSNAARLYGF